MDWEVRIIRHKPLLYIESMDYKVLLYSPGDYMQYPVRNHNGKGYFKEKKVKVKVTQSCPTLCEPYSSWNSLGQNTGVGSLSLLQGIFPTQGSNLGLPHCRKILGLFLGWEDPLEKEMVTHSSILAWRIPWTEEPGRL